VNKGGAHLGEAFPGYEKLRIGRAGLAVVREASLLLADDLEDEAEGDAFGIIAHNEALAVLEESADGLFCGHDLG
jgi:hypothetical protein